MIKNVIFDMGNVLLRYDPEYMLSFFDADDDDKKLLRREIFGNEEWLLLDEGKITQPQAYKGICKRLPERLYPLCADILMNWYRFFFPIDEMFTLAQKLKASGKKLYVLSNAHETFWDYFPKAPIFGIIDGIVLSSDVKLLKPDREIFITLQKQFDLKADECFFIDDTAENVDAAIRLGMKGYVYSGDTDALEKALESC